MYSLSSWETTATDCYVNQGFRKVCVLLPTCSRMNILGAYASAWCGETDMKGGVWLNWVLTSLGEQNSPPRSHIYIPTVLVQWGTALLLYLVSCLNRSEHPWNQHLGYVVLGPQLETLWTVALLFWKLSELWGGGERKLFSKWQKYFLTCAMSLMTSSEKCLASLSGDTGETWEGNPETGVLLVVPLQSDFVTQVMMDVLIWLIFLLPFNVYCIKSFSLILYPIRAAYSMLAMVLQWPNLIAEGRVLYNVVSFSQ